MYLEQRQRPPLQEDHVAQPQNQQQGTQTDGTVVPPSVAIPQDQDQQVEDGDDKPNGPITVGKLNQPNT